MSGLRTGRICKASERSVRRKSRSVLRMLAVMQDRSKTEVPKEFLETGRTGRRNAMPDILHPAGAETTVADLPGKLQQLATSDPDNPQAGPSNAHAEEKKDESNTQNVDGSS